MNFGSPLFNFNLSGLWVPGVQGLAVFGALGVWARASGGVGRRFRAEPPKLRTRRTSYLLNSDISLVRHKFVPHII